MPSFFGFIRHMTLGQMAAWAVFVAIAFAFLLFAYRYIKRQPPLVARTQDTESLIPESKFIEFTYTGRLGPIETKLHYVQVGNGPDIVLFHGIGASVFVWRFLFPLLQSKYRLTAFDIPGFGKSGKESYRDYGLDAQAETLSLALDQLGITKPVLIGSSMGGAIVLWMAKVFPFKYQKIVTLAPATDSQNIPGVIRHFSIATPLLKRALNRRTMRRIVSRVVTRQTLVTDEVVDEYLRPFQDETGSGIRAFWAATAVLSDRRLPRELQSLAADTLVIYGTRDLLVSRRSIDKLISFIPKAQLILHEAGGHHVMEDEPIWTALTVDRFINSKME